MKSILKESIYDGTFVIDGIPYKMGGDLKDLPELDENDPKVKKWLKEEDEAFRKRHSDLTYEEAMKTARKKVAEIEKQNKK